MTIKQFTNKALSHYSYALVSEGKMAVIDPGRNPMPYYQYAEEMNAHIIAVIETHPHADFVSSHLQIHQETGAIIYVSKHLGADYSHAPFNEGSSEENIKIGKANFSVRDTPGHSPDSICVLATDGGEQALFTGDTLFIGNVGRPDLREDAGNQTAKREELAKAMYNTMTTKFNDLADDVLVYPAHGAGSLCGKNMSDASSSTIGQERMSNWAFQEQTEEEFVAELLKDQPMIPHYFGFDVDTNKEGAEVLAKSLGDVRVVFNVSEVEKDAVVVDMRSIEAFKANHLPGSFNIEAIREAQKLETWLGAIIKPKEDFYVVVDSVDDMMPILERVANIGYEKYIEAIITLDDSLNESDQFSFEEFQKDPERFTVLDIRNTPEVEEKKPFAHSIAIPLHELRERMDEVPTDKPIVVHCAAGYRSAAGSSIVANEIKKVPVLDFGEDIKQYL